MSNTAYSYQDVFLKPRYSPYHSRSEVNASVEFGNRIFKIPVMPANMKCTISTELAKWMSENDYFYIMHRFNANKEDAPNADNKKFIELANNPTQAHEIGVGTYVAKPWKTISISIGVKEEDKDLIRWIVENNYRVDYITIDIAHAHSIRTKEMINYVKELTHTNRLRGLPIPFLIAGNVATPEAVAELERWGADATKVGIAQGGACTTYGQTGFGTPMFSCIMDCAEFATKPIIADGGIRMNGDFTKAIVAGGHMVMAGSVFAACIDSPAETVEKTVFTGEAFYKKRKMQGESSYDAGVKTKVFKVYYGSASSANKGNKHHIEGRIVELECNNMTYAQKLTEIEECLQSAVSYAGGDITRADWGVIHRR